MSDGFLHKYFLNNPGKPCAKWLHYFDIYERHFEPYRNTSPTVLEIGVAGGGSLAMWKEYFGPGSQIIGVDISPDCLQHQSPGVDIYIGRQEDPLLYNTIFEKYPHFDIVIDDGSHVKQNIIDTFNILYSRVSSNGTYLIEDTHTSYWEGFGGSFIDYAKTKTDELNAVHTQGTVPITDFTKSTDSITFYDSIVVFKKRPQSNKFFITTSGI